jgi:hypothetical protein
MERRDTTNNFTKHYLSKVINQKTFMLMPVVIQNVMDILTKRKMKDRGKKERKRKKAGSGDSFLQS